MRTWVERGTSFVQKYQEICGVTSSGPTNIILHPIFSLGSSMGNELFVLTFFPMLIWEFDYEVARRTMICWSCVYYLGQVLKDICQLPRPPVSVKVQAANLTAAWGLKKPVATPSSTPSHPMV